MEIKRICERCGHEFIASNYVKKYCSKECRDFSYKNPNSHKYIKRGNPTRLYAVYRSMVSRCMNPNSHSYKRYGGRGITICEEWKNDYESFYEWSMNNGYNPNSQRGKCTLDRINNDGNYEPSNCRWVSFDVQSKNRRNNRYITVNGETGILFDMARKYGVSPKLVHKRITQYGWSPEKAIFEPKHRCAGHQILEGAEG